MSLTKRQEELLKAIINEFIDTAQAVGSLTLSDKYDLGVSPATLRLEMARLVDEGYLYKEHSSSGRLPTTLGMRHFLDEMLEEEDLNVLIGVKLKEKLFQKRYSKAQFLKEAVKALSTITESACLALLEDVTFTSGLSYLPTLPEFENIELLQHILTVIESESLLQKLFKKYAKHEGLTILVGDEIGIESMSACSIIFSPFRYFRGSTGYLAAVGSRRMPYAKILPAVRSVASFIQEAITGWD